MDVDGDVFRFLAGPESAIGKMDFFYLRSIFY
jgi:hypothetical protein